MQAPSPGPAAPAAVPTGTDTYYLERLADFEARRPGRPAPAYYAEYGNKCLQQFRAAQPDFSAAGRAWVQRTLEALQEAMEAKRRDDPAAFGKLELDDDAFHDFAFSTHAEAYETAGIFDLPASDLWRIFRTPDLSDIVTLDGVEEIAELAADADARDLWRIAAATVRNGERRLRRLAGRVRARIGRSR